MAIVSCPGCGTRFKLKDGVSRRTIRCPKCAEVIPVEEEDEARPADAGRGRASRAGVSSHARRDSLDENRADGQEQERPRRRRRDAEDDEDDVRPRHKKKAAAGNKTLVILLCVGALLLVGIGITVIVLLSGRGGSDKDWKVAKDGPKKDGAPSDRGPADKDPPRDFPDKAMFDKGIPKDFPDKGAFDKAFPTDKSGPVGTGDAALILGTWTAVEAESLGKRFSGPDASMRYDFSSDKFTSVIGGYSIPATYTLNPAVNPKTIDATATTPELGTYSLMGIYKLEGDTLTICWGKGVRPTKFSSAGVPSGTMYLMKRGGGLGPGPFKDFSRDKSKDFIKDKDFFKDRRGMSGDRNLPGRGLDATPRFWLDYHAMRRDEGVPLRLLRCANTWTAAGSFATRDRLYFFTDISRPAC